jgi:hypothetical protein
MSGFELLIAYDVVAFVERLSMGERRRLRDRFLEIRNAPGRYSDYVETDAAGRPVDINICTRFAIKYWVDHADRQIKILDVHAADRSR